MSFFDKFFGVNKCNCSIPCESHLYHAVASGFDSLFPFFRFVFSKFFLIAFFMFFLIFSFLVKPGFYSTMSPSSANSYPVSNDSSFFYTDSSQKLYDSLLSSEFSISNTSDLVDRSSENFVTTTVNVSDEVYPSFTSNLPNGSYTGFVEFYDVILSLDKSKVSCLFALNISNSVSSDSSFNASSGKGLVYAYGFSSDQCPISSPKYASFTSVDGKAFLSNFFVF